jgi:hypothetical protein
MSAHEKLVLAAALLVSAGSDADTAQPGRADGRRYPIGGGAAAPSSTIGPGREGVVPFG